MKNTYSVTGELVIWSQEGGYASPEICIKTEGGEFALEEILEMLFGKLPEGNTGKKVTLTISEE